MSGHPQHSYYGSEYRSQRQPAARNPYRASTGNAAALYGAYGGGAGAGASAAPVPAHGHYRGDMSDDWSSTYYGDDSFTDDSVSEDFQRISLADPRRHHGGGHHQPPQQQHPQARYNSYAANVAAGRSGGGPAPPPSHRGHAHSQRAPSPTDSSYSQTTTSASTYAHHRQHVQTAAAFHANQRTPSKSLDRLSHYLPRGYRLAGAHGHGGDDENMDPRFPEDDRSRGVMIPARSVPRTKSLRRPSSPEAGGRGREELMGRHERERRGPEYYAQSEKSAAYKRSLSQDRMARDRWAQTQQQLAQERIAAERMAQEQSRQGRRESRAPPGALLRRSSSIGRFESLSQADKTETPAPPAGALVRRSKSVGPREAYRRRRSLGPVTRIERNFDDPNAGTAVRLDLGGGQDVDISVNPGGKRRGPTIGSITINHNGSSRRGRDRERERERERGRERDGDSGERLLGAPSESARTRTTAAMTDRDREYEEKMRRFHADISSSPPTSPEMDSEEFQRIEQRFNMKQRPRSMSLGTALPRSRAKIPLQIAAPPSAAGPVPQTPGGSEPRHTRISRKIVTRQALEELGYRYEDTGDTFTVFEILQPPQIDKLMDITARIRAARHDRRRARSRGERQFSAEFGLDEYGSRKGPPNPLRPVVNQEEKPFPFREPPSAGPPMPGAWPQPQPQPERRNVPMPDHTRFQRPGPGTLGGPPPTQQPAAGSRFGRREGAAYYR